MQRGISRLLNISPDELGKLAFLWTLYLLFTAGLQVGDGVNQTMFLKRVGVEHLPLMFMAKAGIDLLVAALYVPLAARLGHPRTLVLALGIAGAGVTALWIPVSMSVTLIYPVLYVFIEGVTTLLKIHWGVVLLDCYGQIKARRTFPAIYTGARVGAITGGLILGPLARPLGTSNLLPFSGGLLLAAAALAARVRRYVRRPDSAAQDRSRETAAGRIVHLRQGLAVSAKLPLLRAIALSTAVMVLCRYGLRYHYSETFAVTFDEGTLASFLGIYIAVANTGSIIIQTVVTSRLLAHAGISLTNLLYALCILAAYVGLGLWPGLFVAVAARVMENELKAAIKTPLSNLFYGALPAHQRAAGRAVNLGLVVPISTAVTSALLTARHGAGDIARWGTILAVLFVGATLLQNRAYRQMTRKKA